MLSRQCVLAPSFPEKRRGILKKKGWFFMENDVLGSVLGSLINNKNNDGWGNNGSGMFVIILFLLMSKQFIRGLTAGAVKG